MCKAEAVGLGRRKSKPARRMAEELGGPRKTGYRRLAAERQRSTGPVAAGGRLREQDQKMRELERTVRDLQEENAI